MLLKKMFTTAALVLTAGILFCGTEASAQGMPAFFKKNNAKKSRSDIPTVVESATMDVDLENNKAILIGNVVVDDVSMKIVCNKMIIYMEDKEEAPAADAENTGKPAVKTGDAKTADAKAADAKAADAKAADAKAADAKAADAKAADAKKADTKTADAKKADAEAEDNALGGSGKELKKVECYGDVVITNKADPKDSKAKDQVATSDFALYDLATNTVTLTGKPVLTSGADKLNCEKIVFDLETGRTKIMGGRIISYGDIQKNSKK